jgi:hypothetical protein
MGIGGLFLMLRTIVFLTLSDWHTKPEFFNFNGLFVFFRFSTDHIVIYSTSEASVSDPSSCFICSSIGPVCPSCRGSCREKLVHLKVHVDLFFGFFHQGGICDVQNSS